MVHTFGLRTVIAFPISLTAETISRQGSAVTCEGCGTLMSSMAVLKNHARQCKAQAGELSFGYTYVSVGPFCYCDPVGRLSKICVD